MAGVSLEQDVRSEAGYERASALKEALPLLVALAAGIICYGLFFNRGLGLSVIGYSIAPAERVMQGEVPYRDFLFNYTPGILWVNAFLMKLLGATLMTTRVGLFAFKLITLVALFYLARRVTGRWAALVPIALVLAWLGHQQIFNVYPDQYLMLFAVAGLICMLNYDQTSRVRWLLLCGLSVGAVFLFKYNVGVLLVGSGIVGIAARELLTTRRMKQTLNAVSTYLAGFVVVAGALAGYLGYKHAFLAMINHFLHHAAEYSETRSVTLPSPGAVLPAALTSLAAIVLGFVVLHKFSRFFEVFVIAALVVGSLVLIAPRGAETLKQSAIAAVAYFPPLIFAASLALGFWQAKRDRQNLQRWWRDNGTITITGLFALAVYLEVFPRADFYHLVRVLPPVFLFFLALLVRCLPSVKNYAAKHTPTPGRASLLVMAMPIVLLVLAGVQDTWVPQFDSWFRFRDNHELAIERGRGILVEERQAELTEGLVRLIQENSSPDDYIFSFAQRGSSLYFLAARRNPTRFLWWRSVGISGEERETVMTMIANRKAKLIVVQDVTANKEIQDFIGSNYEHVGTVADIAVYGLRRPVSDATSEKLTVN
jgi:4-amino-4-deoxy-L-arabinose transferase-like glycosyltransferase